MEIRVENKTDRKFLRNTIKEFKKNLSASQIRAYEAMMEKMIEHEEPLEKVTDDNEIMKLSNEEIVKTLKGKYLEGLKDDKGKLRFSLLFEGMPKGLKAVVDVLEHGAKKYGVHNWQKVDNGVERYKEAFFRHVSNLDGGIFAKDPESDLRHIAHIACNALFLLELIEKEKENTNDKDI